MKFKCLYLSLLAVFLSATVNLYAESTGMTGSLIINEVMQSTFGGEIDFLMEYPDGWVEIYNPSDHAVSLGGYAIGKKKKYSKCYVLPPVTLGAHDYYLVYCDKENTVYTYAGYSEIHTDFTMTNAKEGGVYLLEPDGTMADSLHLPVMPAMNVAYGRETDAGEVLGYMLQPTPGYSNKGGIADMVLPDPLFSTSSTIVSDKPYSGKKIRLNITLPEGVPSDAVIRYTLDGTEPDMWSDLFTGTIYISSNTTVKASVFAENCITPPAANRVFIFHGRSLTMPVVSMVTPEENLYDSYIGIIANNYSHDWDKRYNWRRPVIMDYFRKNETQALFTQCCEIRISGAYSRENAQKSFIAYADSRFGSDDWFTAQFWPYSRPDMLESPSIGLRCSGNDFNNSHMRDGVAQMIVGMNTDVDWMGFQPAAVYINGNYYGILNIRERGNEDNVWMHNDRLEDITLLENGELKRGDYEQFREFRDFYSGTGHSLAEYEERMDVVEYTNLMIANIYMGNTDFPGNNYVLWRPLAEGGRWRWIMKDIDRCFGIWGTQYNQPYLKWVLRDPADAIWNETANSEESTRLLRNLMKIKEYRNLFIDRFTVYLGDFFKPDYMNGIMNWARSEMSSEMKYHKQLYGGSSSAWENEVSNMKSWGKRRTPEMYEQLKSYFGLGTAANATINKGLSDYSSYNIEINGIPVNTHVFDGKLYSGREYTVSGVYADGSYDVIGWQLKKTVNGNTRTTTVMEPEITFSIASNVTDVSLTAIRGATGITAPDDVMEPSDVTYFNLQGVSSATPFNGVNIIRYTYPDGSVSVTKEFLENQY